MRDAPVTAIPSGVGRGASAGLARTRDSRPRRRTFKSRQGSADTAHVAALQSIDSLLEETVACGASDLHVTIGASPCARVRGELKPLEGGEPLDAETIRGLLYRILTTEQQKRLEL